MDVVVLSFQVAVISAVWTVLLLIASALLAAAVNHYDGNMSSKLMIKRTACRLLDDVNADAQCSQLIGGAVRYNRPFS